MTVIPPVNGTAERGEQAFRRGAECFSRGDISQALNQLETAAALDHAGAQNLIGLIYLNGIGVACKHTAALELLRKAAAGSREAAFNLSGLLFSGFAGVTDAEAALAALQRAAQQDHRAALRVLGLLYSASSTPDQERLAQRCHERAAALGDVHSMYFVGSHYADADIGESERRERIAWLALAARENLPRAVEKSTMLVEAPGAQQLESLAARYTANARLDENPIASFPPPDMRPYMSSLRQDRSSPVLQQERAVSELLCDYLVNLAFKKLQPSSVIDPVTGEGLRTVLRTSYSMNFLPSMYDMAVGALCNRLASLVGIPAANAEPLVVLKYLPGQEYKPHFDYVPDASQRGQRIATVLLYLNEPAAGGETDFPRLGLRVAPRRAKAIGFYNCDEKGEPDSRTLHAGLPVTQGEKWLATLWFRDRRYDWSI